MRHPIALLLPLTLLACAPVVQPPVSSGSTSPAPIVGTPTQAPATPAPSATATPVQSAAPTATPTASPSAAATAAPTASPSASPAASGFDLTRAKLLRAYDFKGIDGIYYDFVGDQLFVVDGVNDDIAPRRYLMRKFTLDGRFLGSVQLSKDGEKAPEAVDGVAFDLSGTPMFTWREDEVFKLRRIFTATVEEADKYPIKGLERAGVATIAADGDVFTLGVLRYDPEKEDTLDRDVIYGRAAEDKEAEALYRIKDPLQPTVHMAATRGGLLYLIGPKKEGGVGFKRLDKDQKLEDVPITLSKQPSDIWIGPDDSIYLGYETTGATAASIQRYSPTGALLGESEVRLASGAKFFALDGLTFKADGRPILAGRALDAELKTVTGIFAFD